MNHRLHHQSIEGGTGRTVHGLVLASSQPAGIVPTLTARAGTGPSRAATIAMCVIAIVLAIGVLRAAQGFIIPIVLGLLAAYALDPIVRVLRRLGVPGWLAAAAVVAGLVIAMGALAYALGNTVTSALNQLPEATGRLRQELRSIGAQESGALSALGRAADDLEAAVSEAAGRSGVLGSSTPALVLGLRESIVLRSMTLLGMTSTAFMLVLFVYFLLAAGDLFKRKLVGLAGPAVSGRRATALAIDDINRHIERFLVVVVSMNVLVGLCTWAAFHALGVANAGAFAIMAGLLNTIPYLGAAVATAIFFLAALLQFDSANAAAIVAGVFVAITSLEGMLATPWLLGRTVRMNSVAVFAGLLFWGWLWGPWGLVLSFPIMAVIKTVADRIPPMRHVGEILGR